MDSIYNNTQIVPSVELSVLHARIAQWNIA